MKRAVEFAVFVGLAAGVHIAMAAMRPADEGSAAMGAEGEALVSLQAASSSVAEMVEVWERPPEIAETATPPPPPEPVLSEPDMPREQPETPQAMPAPPPMPGLAVPRTDNLPDRSVTAPPPVPVPEAQPDPELAEHRPRLRPAPPERQPAPKQRTKATQTTAASPAQKARGQGGGTDAGQRAEQQAATRDANRQRSLAAEWGATLRARIERRKRYPSAARGISGTVTVRIDVRRDGALRGVAVARSSGHAALDQAALRAVKAASRFPTAPGGLRQSSYTFTLKMRFSG
ncbi:MAG: TonB family protein [Roseovarius sp.]